MPAGRRLQCPHECKRKHVHVIHSLYNSLAIATGDIPKSYLEENADEGEMDAQRQVIYSGNPQLTNFQVDEYDGNDSDVDVVGDDDEDEVPSPPVVRTTSVDEVDAAVEAVKGGLNGIDRLRNKKPTARTMEVLAEWKEVNGRMMSVINEEENLTPWDIEKSHVSRSTKKIVQHSKLMLQPRTKTAKKRKLERY